MALLVSMAVKPSSERGAIHQIQSFAFADFFGAGNRELALDSGCFMTVLPLVCASHCTIISMFAPWKVS